MQVEFSSAGADSAILKLAGDFSLESSMREVENIETRLQSLGNARSVKVDVSGLGQWDSGLLVLMLRARELLHAKGAEFDLSAAPESLRRLIELSTAIPAPEGSSRIAGRPGLLRTCRCRDAIDP